MQATSRGARQLIAPAPRRPSSLVHAPIPAPLLRFSPEYLNPLIFKRFSVVEAKRKASTAATVNLAESLGSTGNVVTSENEAAAAAVPAKKPGKIRQFINKYGWLGVGIYTGTGSRESVPPFPTMRLMFFHVSGLPGRHAGVLRTD